MPEGSNKYYSQAGFTLIEILMAMFILGLIMTTIYASFTGALRNINAAEDTTENYQKARVSFERIIEDLESAFMPHDLPGELSDQLPPRLSGFIGSDTEVNGKNGHNLRFSSEAHVSFERSAGPERTVITYYVKESEDEDSLILLRSDTPEFETQPEEEKGFMLCDGLLSVDFFYQDINGETHEQWDSTDETMNRGRLPAMVSITLEFRRSGGEEYPERFTTSVALPMAKGAYDEAS
ncbi:MAG: prepilin-type N-terminal cleavage/methylation domain-containing protein [Deltaproteobacteria bacterium]|nr:prepilin-type N-terminal cleavage/methylation domain-containing protein [Deltaproteobacteria bacterium]